jgi:hypothetical protein
MLTLARLDRRDTAALVANVAGDSMLLPEIMEEISERTDGVPLFVEELTMAVVESGARAIAAALADQGQRIPFVELRGKFIRHERSAQPSTTISAIAQFPRIFLGHISRRSAAATVRLRS